MKMNVIVLLYLKTSDDGLSRDSDWQQHNYMKWNKWNYLLGTVLFSLMYSLFQTWIICLYQYAYMASASEQHLSQVSYKSMQIFQSFLQFQESGFDSRHTLTECGPSNSNEDKDVFGHPIVHVMVGLARKRPLSCPCRWCPAAGLNLETGKLSGHYIAEISLNVTLNHNKPKQKRQF